MRDILFPLIVVGFFALATLLVKACDRLVGGSRERALRRARPPVSAGDLIGLALALAALGYLVWALLFPERL